MFSKDIISRVRVVVSDSDFFVKAVIVIVFLI